MSIVTGELAGLVGGELLVPGAAERTLRDVQPLHRAGPEDIAFLADRALVDRLPHVQAGALLLDRRFAEHAAQVPPGTVVVLVDDALAAALALVARLRPPRPRHDIGISPRACVAPSARIGAGTNVHPGAVVGEDVVVGAGCDVHSGVSIGDGCTIGDDCVLHPRVVLYPGTELGRRVVVHAGAVLGSDGFGYRLIDGVRRKIPHFGTVRVADDVEIGANSTVDRAVFGTTTIGEGTKIDNLVQVAHNCEIGRHNVVAGQVGFAGSSSTGDHVVIAGQAGVADHVHVGDRCVIGSKSGVAKNVPPGERQVGQPAQNAAEALRIAMSLKKVPEMRQQLRDLAAELAELKRRPAESPGTATGSDSPRETKAA
jgi:UDP-3-O-[3-hydroxymyristoyl] glucosamine N-acyltransferase